MNYLLKFLIVFASYLLATATLVAQQEGDKVILTVLGQHKYEVKAAGLGADIFFQASLDQSAEDRYQYFLNTLALQDIDTTIFRDLTGEDFEYKKGVKAIAFHHPEEAVFLQIAAVLKKQRIPTKKVYYWIPGHRFEDEDEVAIKALEDAINKAELIAKHLGKKVVNVLNVDDKTNNYSYLTVGMSSKDEQAIASLFDDLQSVKPITAPQKQKQAFKERSYLLNVTFELQ